MGAARRLRKKADFERLLKSGARRKLEGYTFYLAPRERGEARLGMMVSRRHARLASDRNAIKRRIREAFRLECHRLGSVDVLVRPPYGVKPSPEMYRQLVRLFSRLNQR
ncbi:MAG TPA: ribonuclease P protein component [Burkholderiales bacterium]|nr:ribonuclease P protein component [Burkholderiales bacterium]